MSYCFLMLHSLVLYYKTYFRFDLAKLRRGFEMGLDLNQLIAGFLKLFGLNGGRNNPYGFKIDLKVYWSWSDCLPVDWRNGGNFIVDSVVISLRLRKRYLL